MAVNQLQGCISLLHNVSAWNFDPRIFTMTFSPVQYGGIIFHIWLTQKYTLRCFCLPSCNTVLSCSHRNILSIGWGKYQRTNCQEPGTTSFACKIHRSVRWSTILWLTVSGVMPHADWNRLVTSCPLWLYRNISRSMSMGLFDSCCLESACHLQHTAYKHPVYE